MTAPRDNYVAYHYDSNGNVDIQTTVPTTGTSANDIVLTALYETDCANGCNKPTWTKDALGNKTEYDYYIKGTDGHSGLKSITAPAAVASATRPKVTYSYSALQAQNSSGSGIGQTVYRLTRTEACMTSASCDGTADESETRIDYDIQTGVGNNLDPVFITRSSGNKSGAGAVSATTKTTYDAIGNVVAVNGPLPGNADTAAYKYDALRRQVGVIGPDTSGGGSPVNPASKVTYDAKGRVTATEQGTTAGQSDGAFASFSASYGVENTYDSADRPEKSVLKSGSTVYSLAQTKYDAASRVTCSAMRMVPTETPPTDACALRSPESDDGPDRITQYTYDNANRVLQVQSGLGTTETSIAKTAYTPNSQIAYVIDGENNRTTYVYDDFDRLQDTQYPVATKGANTSSGSDYERLTYIAKTNLLDKRRLRDGNEITFTYDDLNRVTQISGGTIPTRTFAYNLLGMQTGATFTSGGQSVTNSFDALGRVTRQTSPQGNVDYAYNDASWRTKMTWPDGLSVNYDYYDTGLLKTIKEETAGPTLFTLATYTYDSLGRRTGVAYGNGTSRAYAYDPVSRLEGLKIATASTTYDQVIGKVGTVGTAIGYNPASQIKSLARSNDLYAYTDRYNTAREYPSNGLNQLTKAGTFPITYDARGNLTDFKGSTYVYNGLNQLTSVSGATSATLAYDPADRIYQYDAGSATTRFLYDGASMIAEYNGSNAMQRRYVHGPGIDEPIVWYEGSGTSDRRWLQGDERGSVVSVTGASFAVNRYDEYGVPQDGNVGRFQYTGQAWLPEIGIAYYKARMYAPGIGRFMQTDPIGYRGGLNLYNYAGSDPVNRIDPSGLRDLTGDWRTIVFSDNGSGYWVEDRWATTEDSNGGLVVPSRATWVSLPYSSASDFLRTADIGGTGWRDALVLDGPEVAASTPDGSQTCDGGDGSGWGDVADVAEGVSDWTGAAALGAAGTGLVLAPTGVGLAGAEGAAGVLGIVSMLSSGVAAGANFMAGNNSRAWVNVAGVAGGKGIGFAAERGAGAYLA